MTDIRLKLVISAGGARGDFVCGWAGLTPQALDNWWNINPVTGASSGHFFTKELDRGGDLHNLLTQQRLTLNAHSSRYLVGPCHGTQLTSQQIDQLLTTGAVELYLIDTRSVDPGKIVWEFVVKTYLLHRKTPFFVTNGRDWSIDQSLTHPTDQDRIAAVDAFMRKKPTSQHIQKFYNDHRITMLDYDKLFVPGGSYYLCQQFDFDADQICHRYWDSQLEFCQSPDSLVVWGHEWRRDDYF